MILYLLNHLGCGDHIICNAIYRIKAQIAEIRIPVKKHNCDSVRFMLRDFPYDPVIPVDGDDHAKALCEQYENVLGLGCFGKDFNIAEWDRSFYKQARIHFSSRWDDFYVPRERTSEIYPPRKPYIFVHDDPSRGMHIREEELPYLPIIKPEKRGTLFAYWDVLENAEEIHAMASSFSLLADSIPTKAKRLVLHEYVRKDTCPPIYRKDWERIT